MNNVNPGLFCSETLGGYSFLHTIRFTMPV